jgi:two-component system OmpR family response regulator
MASVRILIVEDDDLLASALMRAVEGLGYAVDRAPSGELGALALRQEHFDLAVLDVGLPGIDGFEVLRRLRQQEEYVAVLMLTARDAVEDRVHGLDLGADDYLVKPFALSEFEARIRALTRRGGTGTTPKIVHGSLTMDTVGHRIWVSGEPLKLTVREWTILEYILLRPGKVVSKERLMHALCSRGDELSPNAIEVYMSRLRSKVERGGVRIRTIRGFGYLLEEPSHAR